MIIAKTNYFKEMSLREQRTCNKCNSVTPFFYLGEYIEKIGLFKKVKRTATNYHCINCGNRWKVI